MKSKHVFLNLFVIKFPITAITSIIHRITGIFLFIYIPFILYFLKLSLESKTSFNLALDIINNLYVKIFIFLLLFSFLCHFILGLKHIIMDIGFFETKQSSSKFSLISLVLICILSLIFLSILI